MRRDHVLHERDDVLTAESAEIAEMTDGERVDGIADGGSRGPTPFPESDDVFTAEGAEIAEMTDAERLDGITDRIIGTAIKVHRALGPGLLESAYEACLAFELVENGLAVERQKPLPVVYRDVRLDCGYRLDLLVEGAVVVEVKSVDGLAPIHQAQVLSYLRLSGGPVGLLINFNVKVLKDGIRRVVNHFPDPPRSRRARR